VSQYVAESCRVLQQCEIFSVLQCVTVCCSVLPCVAVCCSVWQYVAVCWQYVAVCCSVLQYVAVCCSVLQCEIWRIQSVKTIRMENTLQHTATHCNILQHTKTHCNTLQHTTQRTATSAAAHMIQSAEKPASKNPVSC